MAMASQKRSNTATGKAPPYPIGLRTLEKLQPTACGPQGGSELGHVLAGKSSKLGHLAFVGIEAELHGARIDSVIGDRLSDLVVETTLR